MRIDFDPFFHRLQGFLNFVISIGDCDEEGCKQKGLKMQTRLDNSTKRGTGTLDIFEIQETVCFGSLVRFIPESMLVVFRNRLQVIEGKNVKDLTRNERKFVNIVIGMSNAHMLYALSCDEYSDAVWSPRLRTAVQQYSHKRNRLPLQEVRSKDCAERRDWLQRIRDLFPTQETVVSA